MSFEEPIFSFSHSDGPTASSALTPTSPSNFFLQTPTQSHQYQDSKSPWTTAFANTLSPSFKTPSFTSFSPGSSLATTQLPGKDVAAEIATHEKLAGKPIAEFANIQIDSCDGRNGFAALGLSPFEPTSLAGNLTHGKENFHLASTIQTPPPTSSSPSKRQYARIRFDDMSSTAGQIDPNKTPSPRPRLDTTPKSKRAQSPFQFPTLQFSPDVYNFQIHDGPATAPIYSGQRSLWETDVNDITPISPGLGDVSSGSGMKTLDPFVSNNDQHAMKTFSTSPITGQDTHHGFAARTDRSQSPAHRDGPHLATLDQQMYPILKRRGKHVDPNLIFSSPTRCSDDTLLYAGRAAQEDGLLLPYAHQVRDAQIERGLRQNKHRRKKPPVPIDDSPAVKAAVEALREDKSKRADIGRARVNDLNWALDTREVPPHGRLPAPTRSDENRVVPSLRHNVTLRIGSDGRAVAETNYQEESLNLQNYSKSDSSRSTSPSSGVFQRPAGQGPPTMAVRRTRGNSNSSSQSNIPRIAPDLAMQIDSNGMAFHSRLDTVAPCYQTNFVGKDGHDLVIENDEDDDQQGTAQTALLELVRERQKSRARGEGSPLKPSSRRRLPNRNCRSSTMISQRSSNSYRTPPQHRNYHDPQDFSSDTITDPENITPPSNRKHDKKSLFGSSDIRCVCNDINGNGDLMIQCESCRNWLHTSCVGISSKRLPDIYLCTYCKDTPRVTRNHHAAVYL